MPEVRVDSTLLCHYEEQYFGEPWLEAETVLMVHGAAESSRAWYAWVPHLARRYRVLRIDQRGCGLSTPAPADFHWTLDKLAADLDRFLEALAVTSVHLVAAKLGAAVSLHFAAAYPQRVRSLSVLGAPVEKKARRPNVELVSAASNEGGAKTVGMREWASQSMRSRLGPDVSDAQVEWWSDYMGAADPEGFAGLGLIMGSLENFWNLDRIKAPTLVISTEDSALGSVDAVQEWSSRIPSAELVMLPGDSYHIAASEPDRCAKLVLPFIERHAQQPRA